MRADRFDLPLRIEVEGPIPGLAIAVQCGAGELVGLQSSGATLTFDFDVVVDGVLADGRPRLLGPYVQGPPAERFVYLAVGRNAGQIDSAWGGRVKVPLGAITAALIDGMPPNGRLEGRISGRGPRNGPALATVQILAPGWSVASR